MIVKFGHRDRWELGEYQCDTIKELNHLIQQTLTQRQEKWYYSNVNFSEEENWLEIDYGSWTLFWRVEGLTKDNWKEFFGKENERHQPNKLHEIGISIKDTEVGE